MDKDLDMELYNEYLNGEKEAFELLYSKYKNNIQYFIFNIVKDYQKAEDISQEVFIYILQHKVRENCSFKYYIYLVAKSRAYNYINTEKRREELNQEFILSNTEEFQKDVSDIIIKEETKKELTEAINMLEDKYKNVIYLVKIEELSCKEVAEILGESVSNIKVLVHRGKKELRKILLKKGYDEMNKVVKVLVIIVCTTAILTGTVFAGIKIYNEFIKKEDKVKTRGLFDTGDGITTYETDLMANDMTWNEKVRLYHRIITNVEEYKKYKERVVELPGISEINFDEDFVLIIANENIRDVDEKDMKIDQVYVDGDTTHIVLKQKENPDYSNECNVWYAIVDKSQLRENIKVEIEHKKVSNSEVVDIEKLPKDYSIENAINDGCLVVEKNKIISENKNALDEFLEKTEKGESSFIRVYEKFNESITIKDFYYEDGIYYVDTDATRTTQNRTYHNAYQKMEKVYYEKSGRTSYLFNRELNDNNEQPLLIIYK